MAKSAASRPLKEGSNLRSRTGRCACMVAGCTLARKWVNHGTSTVYDYHKCRCEECVYAQKMRQLRYARKRKAEGRYEHGTNFAYSRLGCRCEPCVKAHSVYRRANTAKKKARNEQAR